MDSISRRDFLGASGSFALAAAGSPARAAMGPSDKFDLVIKGGEVCDPSQSLRGRRDIGIRQGMIAAVEADIHEAQALSVIKAGGKLVTPGLIDLHAHVFPRFNSLGIPADSLIAKQCTTTCVCAGDAGADGFAFPDPTRTRLYAFVHISRIGLTGKYDLRSINDADIGLAAQIARDNGRVIGIKVRMTKDIIGNYGLEPLTRAITAARTAGTRVMVHIGGNIGDKINDKGDRLTFEHINSILMALRLGDVLTHIYTQTDIWQPNLIRETLEAKRRGVIFDVGHGGGSFDYNVAKRAFMTQVRPDTISSDMHKKVDPSPGDKCPASGPDNSYLTLVMSKFMALGCSLEDVIRMATVNPGNVIGRLAQHGTLQVGAPGDVSIMKLVKRTDPFFDTCGHSFMGDAALEPVQAVIARHDA